MKLAIVLAILLAPIAARGQDYPGCMRDCDSPERPIYDLPAKPEPVRVINREFKTEVSAMAAAWAMDTISTHQSSIAHPTYHETGWLFTGSRSTVKVMGGWALIDVGAVVLAYEWKRHVHNKYLNPLWRVAIGQRTFAHTEAAIENWRN